MFWKKLQAAKLFCTDTDLTEDAFSSVERDVMKYSSLEYCEFILAFQLQFGIYEAESERFRWGKEKHHLNEWFSR